MLRQLTFKLLAILFVVMICKFSYADVPRAISFQGLLTDSAGTPLNGMYMVSFSLYDVPVGGSCLFCGGAGVPLNLVDGLFDVKIPVVDSFFNDTALYLGISIPPDPEMTPRIKVQSVGYSFRVRTVDGARGGEIAGNVDFNEGGGNVRVRASATNGTLQTYGSDNQVQTQLWGLSWGELLLCDFDGTNDTTVRLSAQSGIFSDGGYLELNNDDGSSNIVLTSGQTGNSSIVLPNSSIYDLEILDEPGVANDTDATQALGGASADVGSRSINCPTSGYVVVMATGGIDMFHSNGSITQGTMWITDTNGGSSATGPEVRWGISGNAPSGSYALPYSVQGVFAVASGLHTYWLRGNVNGGGNYDAVDNELTLMFFPTAYGTINSHVPANSEDLPDFTSDENLPGENFNQARMTWELQQIKQELADLKAKIGSRDQNAAVDEEANR